MKTKEIGIKNLPAHECQCLLALHLCPLASQLCMEMKTTMLESHANVELEKYEWKMCNYNIYLLMVCQCLLHEHHTNALFHCVFLRFGHQIMLVGCQFWKCTAQNSQQWWTRSRSEFHIAQLSQIIQWWTYKWHFRLPIWEYENCKCFF